MVKIAQTKMRENLFFLLLLKFRCHLESFDEEANARFRQWSHISCHNHNRTVEYSNDLKIIIERFEITIE